MLEATSTCETSHAIVHDFPRATANPVEVPREESAALADPSFLLPISSIRPAHVLVIGDNLKLMPQQWREMFPGPTRRVHFAATGRVALKHVRTHSPDVILLDLRLPDQSGLDVYQQIRSLDARIPVIFISNATRADAVIEAMRQGAYDCLSQPHDLPVLCRVLREALNAAHHMHQSAAAEECIPDPHAECEMVGFCPAMQEVYKAIGRVAAQDVPVLITGESGTGKELVARAIYQHGPRAQRPFLALNCAAIPENLLESELFGHEKGAFTGADRRRIGKFEQCDGGTLFLDEIGDIPLSLQAKLLRLLQDQAFERVGGNETIRTNVRLIAATHRDLKSWASEGKFRPDLYYRLGVFTIHLPPLRERGEDLALLVQFYIRQISQELGREVREVAPEALERLRRYSWPGNVRELQSVLKQALLRAHGPVLLPDFLPELPEAPGKPAAPIAAPGGSLDSEAFLRQRLGSDSRDLYKEAHRELDRLVLPRVLEYTGGNQQRAARLLGIARRTLRMKLQEVGLHVAHSVEANEMTIPWVSGQIG
jgi:DNA-binding NtrC family response regulator